MKDSTCQPVVTYFSERLGKERPAKSLISSAETDGLNLVGPIQGRTGVEVQALVREFRQELVAAGYTGSNITVCLEAVYNEDTGVISTNHSVVGDDSCAMWHQSNDFFLFFNSILQG